MVPDIDAVLPLLYVRETFIYTTSTLGMDLCLNAIVLPVEVNSTMLFNDTLFEQPLSENSKYICFLRCCVTIH